MGGPRDRSSIVGMLCFVCFSAPVMDFYTLNFFFSVFVSVSVFFFFASCAKVEFNRSGGGGKRVQMRKGGMRWLIGIFWG